MSMDLLSGVSAGSNGDGAWVQLGGDNDYVFWAAGNFDSGSLELQFKDDQGTTHTIVSNDLPLTAPGQFLWTAPKDAEVRGSLTGAGASHTITFRCEERARE